MSATLSEGRLLDRKANGLALEAEVSDVNGLLDAKAALSGDVDGHPLLGSAHIAKTVDGGWTSDNVALSLASVRLGGADGRRGQPRDRRIELQRRQSRRLLAACADEDERRASSEDQRLGGRSEAGCRHRCEQRPDGLRRQPDRGPKGRSEDRRPVGRAERHGPRAARPRRSRGAIGVRHEAGRNGPGRFKRARFERLRARPCRESSRPRRRRLADPVRPRALHRAGRGTNDRARRPCDADLRSSRTGHPELRHAGRFRPPHTLRPCRFDPRPPRDRCRTATGRARSYLSRPLRVGNRRGRRDDPRNFERPHRRLAHSPSAGQPAADT